MSDDLAKFPVGKFEYDDDPEYYVPEWKPDQVMTGSTADGTVVVRHCTCSYTWGIGPLGNVTEVHRPGISCPTHRQAPP